MPPDVFKLKARFENPVACPVADDVMNVNAELVLCVLVPLISRGHPGLLVPMPTLELLAFTKRTEFRFRSPYVLAL